jgi:hypothetical protein
MLEVLPAAQVRRSSGPSNLQAISCGRRRRLDPSPAQLVKTAYRLLNDAHLNPQRHSECVALAHEAGA